MIMGVNCVRVCVIMGVDVCECVCVHVGMHLCVHLNVCVHL